MCLENILHYNELHKTENCINNIHSQFGMDHNHHMEELPNFAAFHSKKEIQTNTFIEIYNNEREEKATKCDCIIRRMDK